VDETYEDDLNANETTVVELVSGRLYFNTRDHRGDAAGTRGEALSDDGGASFVPGDDTRYRAFRPAPEILDPPVVQCALLRAASRIEGDRFDVILFSGPDENGPSGPGRSDLRIRFSTDEAQSWRDGPLLHTGPAAYSDMVRIDPDGERIGVVFEAGDPGGRPYERIDFVELAVSSLPL
jgi:sialidase-1